MHVCSDLTELLAWLCSLLDTNFFSIAVGYTTRLFTANVTNITMILKSGICITIYSG